MEDCIFCKLGSGQIPTNYVFDCDDFFIIKDIHPVTKLHFLAIPKQHYARLEGATDQMEAVRKIFVKIAELKDELGLSDGYRIIINQGANAHQEVQHLHIHILGGQDLGPKIVH